MNHTNNLLKKYIEKQKEKDKIAEEIYILIQNDVTGSGLDGVREALRMVNTDLFQISQEFIEQFIIKD